MNENYTVWRHAYPADGNPAVMFGLIVLFEFVDHVRSAFTDDLASPVLYSATGRFLLVLAVAFVAAMPIVYPVVFHYRLHVVNPGPGSWVDDALRFGNLGETFRQACTPALVAVSSVFGLFGLWLSGSTEPRRKLLIRWLGICVIGIAYGFVRQGCSQLAGTECGLPQFVPEIHFLLYLRAAQAIFSVMGFGWRGYSWLVRCAMFFRAGGGDGWPWLLRSFFAR